MQASDALVALSLQLQQAAQQQIAAAAAALAAAPSRATGSALVPGQQLSGVVRAWYDEKGFGFIAPDNGGQDVFIHRKQLGEGQNLVQGAAVTFELALSSTSGKPAASRVTVVGGVAGTLGGTTPASTGSIAGRAATLVSAKGLGKFGGPAPSDNLFICGLPLDMTEDKLKLVFNEYGIVTTMRILPDVAGKTDKSALVRMADVSQASWMVEHLNGNIPQGLTSPITVRYADNRAQKARELGLPKPGSMGVYGAAPPASTLAVQRSAPYAAGGSVAAAGGTALGTNALNVLLAALAQLQQQAAPAPLPGQSFQELLQDIQNLQGLTGQSSGMSGYF